MATSKAQRAATAERRQKAVAMWMESHDWDAIAQALGYASRGAAHTDVKRALEARRAELGETVDQQRAESAARLEAMRREAWKVLRTEHVTVSHGRVVRRQVGWEVDADGVEVRDSDGQRIPEYVDLLDDAPVLAAIDRLAKIEQQWSRLWGLEAPIKVEQSGHVAYSIDGVDLDKLV
jgi:hypothetical protein